jgi:hypothetical protein
MKTAKKQPRKCESLAEATVTTALHNSNLVLTQLVEVNGFRLFVDDFKGDYFIDREVSTSVKPNKSGEYAVNRQRRKVRPERALLELLNAAIPSDFNAFLRPLTKRLLRAKS